MLLSRVLAFSVIEEQEMERIGWTHSTRIIDREHSEIVFNLFHNIPLLIRSSLDIRLHRKSCG
jgi:hypothetical protein